MLDLFAFFSAVFLLFPDLFEALVELGNSGSQVVGQMSHPVPLFAQLGSLIIKCNQQLQEVCFEKFVYILVSCLFTICFSLQSSKKDKKIEKKLKEFYVKALQDFFFENQCLIPMSFFQLPLQGLFTL